MKRAKATLADAPISASLTAEDVELSNFVDLLPKGTQLTGRVDGHVDANGTIAAPRLAGSLALRDGTFDGPVERSPITEISADLAFAGNRAQLESHASVGGGAITAQATAALADLRSPGAATFTAQARATNARLDLPEYFQGTLNGSVALVRSGTAIPQLTGDMTVANARIPLNSLLNQHGGPKQGPGLPNVAFHDVRLSAGSNVRVQSANVDVGTTGSALLGGTLDAPTLAGTFRSTGGSLSFYRNFYVERATVNFDPSSGVIPDIDAVATTFVPDPATAVRLQVTGQVTNMNLELASDPSYDREQILGLLVGAQQFGAVRGVQSSGGGAFSAGSAAQSLAFGQFEHRIHAHAARTALCVAGRLARLYRGADHQRHPDRPRRQRGEGVRQVRQRDLRAELRLSAHAEHRARSASQRRHRTAALRVHVDRTDALRAAAAAAADCLRRAQPQPAHRLFADHRHQRRYVLLLEEVSMTNLRALAALLALALVAATPRPPVGFIDLPRLVASDPLHGVLQSYDREIAALRKTQNLPGLGDVATQASRAANAARADGAAAKSRVRSVAARNQQTDRARERAAVAGVLASQRAGDADIARYSGELRRETDANASNYASALATRNDRAYAARAQQLREKELTLAFDLARKNAGTRLSLRLKLSDLHLTKAKRAMLQAQLAALDAQEQRPVAALRARDAGILVVLCTAVAGAMPAEEGAAMDARLRQTAGANFAVRERVRESATAGNAGSAKLAAAASSFAAGYRLGTDAADVASGFGNAGDDLSRRFARLADAANVSQRATAAELGVLTRTRDALYRSIVSRIQRQGALVARRNGVAKIEYGQRAAGRQHRFNESGSSRAPLRRLYGPDGPCSGGDSAIPAALRIAATSLMSASPSESFGGQVRSGEVHPCHEMWMLLPNDALFMHGTVATLPLRAAARSEKNFDAVAAGTANGLGVLAAVPPCDCSDHRRVPIGCDRNFVSVRVRRSRVDDHRVIARRSRHEACNRKRGQ